MKTRFIVSCFGLAVGSQVAADVLDDCNRQLIRPELRVRACSEIIASPSFGSSEKARAYASRGKARVDAGAIRSALADFTESLRIEKENVPALAGRGWANFMAGNRIGSLEDYNDAIRLSPNSAELHIERSQVYLASGKVDDAISDLNEAIRLDPQNAIAFNGRGVAYAKKGDLVRAHEDYTKAIALLPFPEFYANRARVLEAQGRRMDAIDDLRSALLGDPSLTDVRDVLKRLGAGDITIETERRVREGELLAEKKCSGCHAVGVRGYSPNQHAPEFRSLSRKYSWFWLRGLITRRIFATHEQMPQFDFSREDVDTIVAYINSLSSKK